MSAQGYIVVFNDGVTSEQISNYINDINTNGGKLKIRYDEDGGINGFAAAIPDSYFTKFQSLTGDVVKYIEPDGEVHINIAVN